MCLLCIQPVLQWSLGAVAGCCALPCVTVLSPLLIILPMWSSACLFHSSVEDTPVKLLSESAAGRLCALKTNPVHVFKVFTFCGCLNFFSIVKYVLFRCRWISFIHCSTKLTWIMLSLFLKISLSQSHFALFMYLLYSLLRQISIRGALRICLPRFCQHITTKFLMLTLAPFIYWVFGIKK